MDLSRQRNDPKQPGTQFQQKFDFSFEEAGSRILVAFGHGFAYRAFGMKFYDKLELQNTFEALGLAIPYFGSYSSGL